MAERHLAALTLVRSNGHPHTTPVGFTWDRDTGSARIITWSGSVKARLLEKGHLRASVCQVDGGRWLTIEGVARVTSDLGTCAVRSPPTPSATDLPRIAATNAELS